MSLIRLTFVPMLLLAAGCGQSNEQQLDDAANQSDPTAAAVLNHAAENGMDPQEALEAAGQAQTANAADAPQNRSVQAKPNLPSDPNRPEGGQPPEKRAVPVDNRQ